LSGLSPGHLCTQARQAFDDQLNIADEKTMPTPYNAAAITLLRARLDCARPAIAMGRRMRGLEHRFFR
jgi:hypothetical protein